jgi:hypothetical protein
VHKSLIEEARESLIEGYWQRLREEREAKKQETLAETDCDLPKEPSDGRGLDKKEE